MHRALAMTPTHHVGVDGAMLAAEWCAAPLSHVPPLVFLHAGVADSRMWNAQATWAKARGLASLRYDRRGFGRSSIVFAVRHRHVADLWSVLDAVGIERAMLVGCSQGGRIAIDAALEAPRRVAALVLVAPAISGAKGPVPEPELTAPIEAAIEQADAAGDLDALNRLEARLWLDGPRAPEGRVSGTLRERFLDMNGIALRSPPAGEAIEPPSAWTRLDRIACPTLVVRGDLDEPVATLFCDRLVAQVPQARLAVIEGTAHLPPMEAPERFNALLDAEIARSGYAPPP